MSSFLQPCCLPYAVWGKRRSLQLWRTTWATGMMPSPWITSPAMLWSSHARYNHWRPRYCQRPGRHFSVHQIETSYQKWKNVGRRLGSMQWLLIGWRWIWMRACSRFQTKLLEKYSIHNQRESLPFHQKITIWYFNYKLLGQQNIGAYTWVSCLQ